MAITPQQLRASRRAIEAAFRLGTSRALRKLGPVGTMLGKLLGVGGTPTAADIANVGRALARPIIIPRAVPYGKPLPTTITRPAAPGRDFTADELRGLAKLEELDKLPPTHTPEPYVPRRQRTPPGTSPLPGEATGRTVFTRTPNSTNVYGFYFQPDSSRRKGTLYITFKAADRSEGEAKGRRNTPGAQYAYYDVPVKLYVRLLQVKNAGGHEGGDTSPGTFVWDHLRVRGSLWGHQFQYRLVQAEVGPSSGGQGEYVPRKVTRLGFKTRAIVALGSGRRSFSRSTLPAQTGHGTRRRRLGGQ